jgi:hypothetical protein
VVEAEGRRPEHPTERSKGGGALGIQGVSGAGET